MLWMRSFGIVSCRTRFRGMYHHAGFGWAMGRVCGVGFVEIGRCLMGVWFGVGCWTADLWGLNASWGVE